MKLPETKVKPKTVTKVQRFENVQLNSDIFVVVNNTNYIIIIIIIITS